MSSQSLPTKSTFDDADPRIDYSGLASNSSWDVNTGDPQEFFSTSHVTNLAGSKATVKFKGSSISVFGTIGLENNAGDPSFAPISAYTMDGSSSETYVGTPNQSGVVYGQMFYQSGSLDATKEHTLVIMNTAAGKNLFRLDYFQINGAPGVDPALVDTGASDPLADTGTTVISHKVVVWGSIGAVLGLLFLLAITIMLFMLVRQNRRKEYALAGEERPPYSCWPCRRKKKSKITPFNYASPSDQAFYPRNNRPPRRYPGYNSYDNDDEALVALRSAAEREDQPPAYHHLSVRQPPSGSRVAEHGSSSDDKRPISER